MRGRYLTAAAFFIVLLDILILGDKYRHTQLIYSATSSMCSRIDSLMIITLGKIRY